MSKYLRILLVVLLFGVLAGIRFFEHALFYDPLLGYFKEGYMDGELLPAMHKKNVLASIAFRYWLNGSISLVVLFVAFGKKSIIKFALLFFASAFIVLIGIYGYLIANFDPDHYLGLFYTRRFLIQPVFIILLIPAFYYNKILIEQRNLP